LTAEALISQLERRLLAWRRRLRPRPGSSSRTGLAVSRNTTTTHIEGGEPHYVQTHRGERRRSDRTRRQHYRLWRLGLRRRQATDCHHDGRRIDKQIYLPYQLAQNLGFYKKYGVNVQLSTEQTGGVGAETAMVSGQVDMAGAWYVHTIDFQQKGKNVVDVVNLSGAPGEREMCSTSSGVNSPASWAGKSVAVTDIGSGTDNLTLYLAARYHLTSQKFSRVAVGAGNTLVADSRTTGSRAR